MFCEPPQTHESLSTDNHLFDDSAELLTLSQTSVTYIHDTVTVFTDTSIFMTLDTADSFQPMTLVSHIFDT